MIMGFPVALARMQASALERGQPIVSCAFFNLPVSSQRSLKMCLVILMVTVVSFASMIVSLDISSFSRGEPADGRLRASLPTS